MKKNLIIRNAHLESISNRKILRTLKIDNPAWYDNSENTLVDVRLLYTPCIPTSFRFIFCVYNKVQSFRESDS